ncbi:MAG: hypothetical protein KUG70_10980 [Rhodobacteraceae bacterium]|nr:hypothetical protein [Paracoccaceae bacterium]
MIALLFVLFACAMALAWYNRVTVAYAVFGVTLLMSVYWLKFHATTALTIQL